MYNIIYEWLTKSNKYTMDKPQFHNHVICWTWNSKNFSKDEKFAAAWSARNEKNRKFTSKDMCIIKV